MEKTVAGSIRFCSIDNVSTYLPYIDSSAMYAEFYGAVSENAEDILRVLAEDKTVGLAAVSSDGEEGYLYSRPRLWVCGGHAGAADHAAETEEGLYLLFRKR